MSRNSITLSAIVTFLAVSGCHAAFASDDGQRITIPARSKLSPVQKLNRDGVEEVKKGHYDKAQGLFYKAYLYDPADPFTLNNLGYVSELQGQLDRAHRFYMLAAEQGSDANIDSSNQKHLKGQPMKSALVDLQDATMRVNRMNLDAMRLLNQDRSFEAIAILQQALPLDPHNAFTLNNLGVASESVADLDSALRYYQQAAASRSKEPTVVTVDKSWRGKSVSSMAQASANRLQKKMRTIDPAQAKAVMFTLRGVHAENENDWTEAKQDFLQAYALAPASAFSINNRGYVAEREGDLETAQHYYEKARRSGGSSAQIGLATKLYAQGKPLATVANDSDQKVDTALDSYSRQRRQEAAPVELTPRGDAPQQNPEAPETQPRNPQSPQ